MSEPLSEAKQTLLRALDAIEELEQESGTEVRHVAVVYAVWHEDDDHFIHDKSGWNHSTAPAWLIGAMLRNGADAIEAAVHSADEDDDG